MKGHIEFRGVYLKYRKELDYALRNLTFKISGGTRVGIVGRTGMHIIIRKFE